MDQSEKRLLTAGGKLWEKEGRRRVYFNGLPELCGLEVHRYNTGSISSAYLDGEKLSNTKAARLVGRLEHCKLWFDLNSNEWRHQGLEEAEFARCVRAIEEAAG